MRSSALLVTSQELPRGLQKLLCVRRVDQLLRVRKQFVVDGLEFQDLLRPLGRIGARDSVEEVETMTRCRQVTPGPSTHAEGLDRRAPLPWKLLGALLCNRCNRNGLGRPTLALTSLRVIEACFHHPSDLP